MKILLKFRIGVVFLGVLIIALHPIHGQPVYNYVSGSGDYYDTLSINGVKYWFSTNGSTGTHPYDTLWADQQRIGIVYPAGSSKGLSYTEGFLLCGWLENDIRAVGSYYADVMQAGRILPSGVPNEKRDAKNRIYRVRNLSNLEFINLPPHLQAQCRTDFLEYPVDLGAPYIDRNGNGVYDPDFYAWLTDKSSSDAPRIQGDEMLWYVMNDLDSSRVYRLFDMTPIGMEVQVTAWQYKSRYPLTTFIQYKVINKGQHTFPEAYFLRYADSDIGLEYDDYTGVDTTLQMMYFYNGQAYDSVYEATPPVVATKLLAGPVELHAGSEALFDLTPLSGYRNMEMSSYTYLPQSGTGVYEVPSTAAKYGAVMWYNYLQRTFWNERPYIDLTTEMECEYPMAGYPEEYIGWYDGYFFSPGPRSGGLGTGPFVFAPGDTQTVVYAHMVIPFRDSINATLADMRLYAAEVQRTVTSTAAPETPSSFALGQNYPNPVTNGRTVVRYSLDRPEEVSIRLYDLLGRLVQTAEYGRLGAGEHQAELQLNTLRPGVYYYILSAGGRSAAKMMMVR
ncbi:MAG: hypothetical protein CL946_11240 [Ectothiorhodospiraceae bacterium]|nr:hypothetical protein [Ectothiorhodospiraceae bacterium]